LNVVTQFTKPKGTNFSTGGNLPADILSKALCKTVSFLQTIAPYVKLHRYEDWWEHDGLHFSRGVITFDDLFSVVRSPRALLEAMPGDEDVFIGLAPEDSSWYLRVCLSWDDNGFNLLGRFDITLPRGLAERYKEEVGGPGLEMVSRDAEAYYRSIIL
jgi:hypothetical protein